jgi:hypothetical protein
VALTRALIQQTGSGVTVSGPEGPRSASASDRDPVPLRRLKAAGPTTMRTIQTLCGACRLRCSVGRSGCAHATLLVKRSARRAESARASLPCCGSRMIIIMGQPLWQAASCRRCQPNRTRLGKWRSSFECNALENLVAKRRSGTAVVLLILDTNYGAAANSQLRRPHAFE